MRFTMFILLFCCAVAAHAGIVGKEVTYTADSLTMKGYIAYDDKIKGKRPGVVVVHEWWGHNDYTRKRAEMLAEMGYVAIAVDMYGEGKQAAHPEDAGKFAGAVMQNMPAMKARFNAALELLKKDEHTDASQISAIGYCFGGGVVLAMARDGADLKAVVSFHGSLGTQTPAEKGKVKAKVLVCNGADDTFVSEDAIKDFKSEMDSAGVDYQFENYPGAIHGFTNPSATEKGKKFGIGIAYNENADKKSWEDMQKLFKKVFKK